MSTEKTFYVIDGHVFVSAKNDNDSEAAARLRDAWSALSEPVMNSPFYQNPIGPAFRNLMADDVRFLAHMPQPDNDEPWPETLKDADLYRSVLEEAGTGVATIYALDRYNPTYTRDTVPLYPEPLLTVMKKAEGSNLLDYWSCTSLREFVLSNLDRNDPNQTVLYQVGRGDAEYALVAGDKLEHTLEVLQARIEDAKDMPRNADSSYYEVTDSYPLLRALEDHKRRVAPDAPKP